VVDAATVVEDSTLLSNTDEPTRVDSGGCVLASLLQWGSSVGTLAIVERSLLSEYTRVERQGRSQTASSGRTQRSAQEK
jgi:hypothetical protein